MQYRNYQTNDALKVFNLYDEFQKEDDFYKKMDYEEFKSHLLENPSFSPCKTYIAEEGDELIGIISFSRKLATGYIHTFIVKKEYRRKGIGSCLLKMAEENMLKENMSSARLVFLSPINWPWYIPHTARHLHPGAPAVPINSEFYIFLYHRGYHVNSIHEGFHLPLLKYDLSLKVKELIEKNEKKGLSVAIYNPSVHFGINEFVISIKDENPGFAEAIAGNLKRKMPYPFLVATDNGKVVGWTGAIWNEACGRGHFDGIIVDKKYRGLGLGKILFSVLCLEEKKNGAEYMTFFTGLDNPARYIYLGAGFKVAMSFADMIKKFTR